MRRVVLIGVVAVLAGCGGGDKSESLPGACTDGSAAIGKALASAPGAVKVNGTTPISDCFNRDANSDDIQIVGGFLLAVAQQLGDRARAGDEKAALQLGYLVGAASRGAKRNGLGDEIVRRLEAETTIGAAGKAAYDRGLRAGSAGG